MRAVTPSILEHVCYALAMPNNGPVASVDDALRYHAELMQIVEERGLAHVRQILMTVYHTADTTAAMIEQIAASNVVRAVKHYPPHKGATTGSGQAWMVHNMSASACASARFSSQV